MQIPGGPSDWAQQEVALALATGLVPNGLDGHYQRSITRAEFCSLGVQLLTALGSPLTGAGGGQTFTDTSDPNVLMMSGAGIVTGHGDGTFGPDGSITRQEAAVMLDVCPAQLGAVSPTVQHFPTRTFRRLPTGPGRIFSSCPAAWTAHSV